MYTVQNGEGKREKGGLKLQGANPLHEHSFHSSRAPDSPLDENLVTAFQPSVQVWPAQVADTLHSTEVTSYQEHSLLDFKGGTKLLPGRCCTTETTV